MSLARMTRCSLIWLAFMMLIVNGDRLLRAQEKLLSQEQETTDKNVDDQAKVSKTGSSATEVADLEVGKDVFSVPDWFDESSEFSAENPMVFVETNDDAAITIERAEAKLRKKSVRLIKNTVAAWMQMPAIEDVELEADYVFEKLLYQGRHEIKENLECEMLAKQGDLAAGDIKFYTGYAQFEINDQFRGYLKQRLNERRTKRRLIRSGFFGGSVLAILVVIFGYLKMETATRGFYSRRLQTISFVLAAVIVAAFYWFGKQFV